MAEKAFCPVQQELRFSSMKQWGHNIKIYMMGKISRLLTTLVIKEWKLTVVRERMFFF